jgi:hypothetical protein
MPTEGGVMKRTVCVLSLLALACSIPGAALSRDKKVIEKSFDPAESIKIETVLGGCTIRRGESGRINVRVEYTYDDEDFEVRFRERGSTLYIEEDLDGNNPKGGAEWFIEVPEGIDIDFESATGGLTVSGTKGELEANSGTGGITVTGFSGELDANSGTGKISLARSTGEFKLNSGTGNVSIQDCGGSFDAGSGTGSVEIDNASGDIEANSGTGDVEAFDLTLESYGEFSSGTGDAEVELPDGEEYDLEISSGTGNASLDCGGADLDAYVEMTAKKRSGRISSSFEFEDEEEFHQGDDEYVRKWFTAGSGARKIEISTGTGRAKLKR